MRFSIFLFLLLSSLHANPWGKDANIQYIHPCAPHPSKTSLAEALITFHQEVISPCDGPRSHYFPSSSAYTKEAMHRYGFLTGFLLGCDRLLRENDDTWVYPLIMGEYGPLKFDPVPCF